MLTRLKKAVRSVPVLGAGLGRIYSVIKGRPRFQGSREFWEDNYAQGGDSGGGSYGELAAFKAGVLNAFVAEHAISSVIEFGCGDGNQLSLANYPFYLGLDVSKSAIARCRTRFAEDPDKSFKLVDDYAADQAELSLSLDVVYHLVEDGVYEDYMRRLFAAATRYVIIYSSDWDDEPGAHTTAHIKHRRFTPWIADNMPGWKPFAQIKNRYGAPYRPQGYQDRVASNADFHIYEKL